MTNAMNNNKFAWCQFYSNFNENQDNKNQVKTIVKYVKKLKKKLDDDSLLVVAFTGRHSIENENENNKQEDLFLKGRCFLIYKCKEIEILEKEIKDLYKIVKEKQVDMKAN
jgi:hypothetical protein